MERASVKSHKRGDAIAVGREAETRYADDSCEALFHYARIYAVIYSLLSHKSLKGSLHSKVNNNNRISE